MKKLFIFIFLMFSLLLSSCNSEDEENRVLSDVEKTEVTAYELEILSPMSFDEYTEFYNLPKVIDIPKDARDMIGLYKTRPDDRYFNFTLTLTNDMFEEFYCVALTFKTPNSNDFVSLVEMEVKNQELFIYIKFTNRAVSILSIGTKLLFVYVPREYINKSTNITYYIDKASS